MTLWNRIDITVCMELVSADPSGVLTALQQQGFELHDVRWIDDLTNRFCVSGKQFRALERIAAGKGNELKILQRKGMLYTLQRFTRRPVLVFCLLLFLMAGFFLPSRIFFLQVEGNSIVPTNLILEKASACGICFGASRREVRSEKMKNALLEAMPQLQWAGINTSGCVATISVRERAAEEESPRSSGISSIVATRDAIVQFLTVTNGSAVCKVGQAVRSGQILISGYTDCGLLIRGCRASGEVYGLTERDLTLISPTQFRMRGKMEGQSKKYAVIIGKKRINFYKGSGISDTSCDKMYLENYVTLPGGFILPIAIATEVWTQYSFDDVTDPADPSAFADLFLAGMMRSGRILSRNEIITNKEGIAILDGHYQCHEMIGIQQQEEIVKPNE